MWLADTQMNDWAEVDWQYQRTDAPPGARGSGHGDADYCVHTHFRDAVREGKPLPLDVYRAMNPTAPAIRAYDSILEGGKLMKVHDFRPGSERNTGEMPVGV
ncbi:MAG: hypothetical protein OXU79_05535 [Gemmatimonadota bacterium]|nr:hypothetical protein [Gemmatimonadota bacterium]